MNPSARIGSYCGMKVSQMNETLKFLFPVPESKDYVQLAAVPTQSTTHSGEDVAVLARGPMSHLFQGVQEQNYIAHAVAYAACVGADLRHCQGDIEEPVAQTTFTNDRNGAGAGHGSAAWLSSLVAMLLALRVLV